MKNSIKDVVVLSGLEFSYLKDFINVHEFDFENDLIHCEPGANSLKAKIGDNFIKVPTYKELALYLGVSEQAVKQYDKKKRDLMIAGLKLLKESYLI